MLKITIPASEQYDEVKQEFINFKEQVLALEHSLVSISKWEAKWNKPFLTDKAKSYEEWIDYTKCMTVTQNVSDLTYKRIGNKEFMKIKKYIDSPMTATTFSNIGASSPSRDIITSEVIYYKMVYHGIPFECQKWHLNRLLTLIRVCDIKSMPPKKMSTREIMNRNRALNEQRKRTLKTRG